MKKRLALISIAAALTAVAVVGVLAYGLGAPTATLLGPAIVREGRPGEAALTFDDGPSPYTAQVLDILRREHVRATFFLCGANARRYPELTRRILAEGHEIGNHTYSHPWLYLTGRETIAGEIDRTQDELERITGRRPTLFRPPHGVRWFSLWPLLAERGLTMVLWTDWGRDGEADAAGIEKRTLSQLTPGAIILLHDGSGTNDPAELDRSSMVRALPGIIAGVRQAGYAFAPVRADAGIAPAPLPAPAALAVRRAAVGLSPVRR